MTNCKFPPEVQEWIDIVEKGTYEGGYRIGREQKQLVKHIKKCFREQNIYIDTEQLENYMKICKRYIPFELLPWQKFIIALHDCTYWTSNNEPRWTDLFVETGRGNGKDGMITVEAFVLSSPYNHVREYDVDICANNEEQAMRPVEDLASFLNDAYSKNKKIKNFYSWTQQIVRSVKTGAKIKGRTNNPKGRDGMRSGIVIFNEVHQYENYDNINVFKTGLGKKPNARTSYYTTNGEVREGPLDELEQDCLNVLASDPVDDNGLLPFICRLPSEKDIDDERNWSMANPSMPYWPHLYNEIKKEYKEWKQNPQRWVSFPNKRMNLRKVINESAVTDWDNIAATNQKLPDLKGYDCTAGIDYSKSNDWMSVNLHFRKGDKRYDINHSWICAKSVDLPRIKAPWKTWVDMKLVTYVDDVEIHPSIVVDYIQLAAKKYNVKMVAIDEYRHTLLADALSKAGFTKQNGNLMLVRQIDILKVVPVIEHYFIQHNFVWGDNPVLRWATNNTKLIKYGKKAGADKGSFVYAKIEAKSRKTDPFMALVASVCAEGNIVEHKHRTQLPVIKL